MALTDELLAETESLLNEMLSHPFLDDHSENRLDEQFGAFVQFLGNSLNDVGEEVSDAQRDRMLQQFRSTVRYEIAFLDMAYGRSGDEWLRTEVS